MSNDLIKCGFTITTEPSYQFERHEVTPWLREQMERLYFESQDKSNRNIIGELKDLITRFPDIPQLKNYLMTAYFVRGRHEKSREVNHWALRAHPDYLFGKINLAFEYFAKDKFEKIAELLGEKMDLKALYPDRDCFHLAEVVSFYKLAVMYFCSVHNLEAAEARFEILKEVSPDNGDMEEIFNLLVMERLRSAPLRWLEEEKNKIKVASKKLSRKGQKTAPPDFIHPEIQWLYEYDLTIDRSKLETILSLPRASLIKDLETVLQDAVQRYYFFYKKQESGEWDDNTMMFPVHALFLLGELRATESLREIFELLSQHEDVLEFWFSDFLTEVIWEPLYYLVEKDIPSVREFLLKPGVYTYSKTAFTTAIAQLVLHNPERSAEVIEFFNGLFAKLATTGKEANVIDSDFIASAIGDATDSINPELLPSIKTLYEMGYVSIGICGTYDELIKHIQSPNRYISVKTIMNIYDRYDEISKGWVKDDKDDAGDDKSDFRLNSPYSNLTEDEMDYDIPATHHPTYINTQPFIAPPKTGRNELCPCGSGKKYKKCCMDK